ncbi:hypothetical protein AB9F45_39275, partial [Rhizobium leguminosarum]
IGRTPSLTSKVSFAEPSSCAFAAAVKLQAARPMAGRGKQQGGGLLWAARGSERLLRVTTHKNARKGRWQRDRDSID